MKRHYVIGALLLASTILVWYTVKRRAQTPTKPTSNVIIVGTNAEYQPFTFIQNSSIIGLDIDIAREVCRRLNKEMVLKDMAFTALIPALQSGAVQFAAAGMTPTPERAQRVLFTKPYLEGDELLIVTLAKNPEIKSVDQLTGKTVIVNEGYVSDTYMSKVEGPTLLRLANPSTGFMALSAERADSFVIARSSAVPFFKQRGEKEFNIATIEETGNKYALAVSKKYPELLGNIQKALDAMQQDGTLESIIKQWGF